MNETSLISEKSVERIESQVSNFYDVVQSSLKFRLSMIDGGESSRVKAERLTTEMITAANLAVDIEEHLVAMLIIQQHIHMLWDDGEAQHLQAMAKMQSQQFVSKEGKLAGLIQSQNDLYQTKCRIDACVEAGRRAVDRLENIRTTASRAAGLIYGPAA